MTSSAKLSETKRAFGYRVLVLAYQLIGCPYKHRGRTETGLDCVGLILMIGNRLGGSIPDVPVYHKCYQDGIWIHYQLIDRGFKPSGTPEIGDVLLLNGLGSNPQHLAIYTGWSDRLQSIGYIHAHHKVCEVALDINRQCVHGVFKWPQRIQDEWHK